MPLITLETTTDLIENDDLPEILSRIVDCVANQETIDPKSIRASHVLVRTWAMGAGAPAGFAHCGIAVLAGRPVELRSKVTESVLETLKDCFSRSLTAGEVNLTVELREMTPETYRKLT